MSRDGAPFVVSLIGRPNVGKSMLFNRLQGKMKKAITQDLPGVTRDRHYTLTHFVWADEQVPVILVDTGGFDPEGKEGDFFHIMKSHARLAIEESDLILFVVDIREGLLPADREICHRLRAAGKPFAMVINKVDPGIKRGTEGEFYRLGVESLFMVSAAHGRGMEGVESFICGQWEQWRRECKLSTPLQKGVMIEPGEEAAYSLCLVGVPNGGKSTLLNWLLKEPRALVSHVAGTTVDPVEGYFHLSLGSRGSCTFRVVDTAGVRRRSLVVESLERQSVYRALRAVGEADVVVCVVDATKKTISHQDRRLVDIALDRGASVVVVLNKMDLLCFSHEREEREWLLNLRDTVSWLDFCTLIPLSAKTGKNMGRFKDALKETVLARSQSIPTSQLNQVVSRLVERHPLYPKGSYHKLFKVKYAALVKHSPVTIMLFTNLCRNIPSPYQRYLQKGIREAFSLVNTPIHLVFRGGSGNSSGKAKRGSLPVDHVADDVAKPHPSKIVVGALVRVGEAVVKADGVD